MHTSCILSRNNVCLLNQLIDFTLNEDEIYILWQHLEPCSAQYPFAESHSLQLNGAPTHGHQPERGRGEVSQNQKGYLMNNTARIIPCHLGRYLQKQQITYLRLYLLVITLLGRFSMKVKLTQGIFRTVYPVSHKYRTKIVIFLLQQL